MYLLDANPTSENIAKVIYGVTLEAGFPIVEAKL